MSRPKVYLETSVIICTPEELMEEWSVMWQDPVVEEVRRAREELSTSYDHDLRKIVEEQRREERQSGRRYMSYPSRRADAATTQGQI